MNHHCHGELFTVNGTRQYRCFADSSNLSSAVSNGDQCPSCGRTIVAVIADAETVTAALEHPTDRLPRGRIRMSDENLALMGGLGLFASTTAAVFGHQISAAVLGVIGITLVVCFGWSKRGKSRAKALKDQNRATD